MNLHDIIGDITNQVIIDMVSSIINYVLIYTVNVNIIAVSSDTINDITYDIVLVGTRWQVLCWWRKVSKQHQIPMGGLPGRMAQSVLNPTFGPSTGSSTASKNEPSIGSNTGNNTGSSMGSNAIGFSTGSNFIPYWCWPVLE